MEPLYKITNDYQQALNDLKNMDDEAVRDTLEGLKGAVEVKATNVAKFIGNVLAQTAAMKLAEKNMAARRKVLENKVVKLKEYIKGNMEACKIHSIECPEFSIKIKKNPPKLVLGLDDLIPKKYKRTSTTTTIERNEIKKALSSGKKVSGARLEQTTRLEIK